MLDENVIIKMRTPFEKLCYPLDFQNNKTVKLTFIKAIFSYLGIF